MQITIHCNLQCNVILEEMQYGCNAINDVMQFPKQYKSQSNAIAEAMQFPMQCNTRCNAIPDVMQFLMQWFPYAMQLFNATPDTMQFLM